MAEDFTREGHIHFWLTHPTSKKWAHNAKSYSFPPIVIPDTQVKLTATKNTDRTLSLAFTDANGLTHEFRPNIPKGCLPNAICVDVTWQHRTIRLYLDGEEFAASGVH